MLTFLCDKCNFGFRLNLSDDAYEILVEPCERLGHSQRIERPCPKCGTLNIRYWHNKHTLVYAVGSGRDLSTNEAFR